MSDDELSAHGHEKLYIVFPLCKYERGLDFGIIVVAASSTGVHSTSFRWFPL
jgi:hypothetical protein